MVKMRDREAKSSQIDKFKEAARELECDDDEAVFREKRVALRGGA